MGMGIREGEEGDMKKYQIIYADLQGGECGS